MVDLNEYEGIALITENTVSPDGSTILFGQGFFGRALVCADTPQVDTTAPLWALDGRGGKRFLGEVGFEIIDERVEALRSVIRTSARDYLPCNDYCIQTMDQLVYRFALASEARSFDFNQDMSNVSASFAPRLGWRFLSSKTPCFSQLDTTDENGNAFDVGYFGQQSERFSTAIFRSSSRRQVFRQFLPSREPRQADLAESHH